jgi:hypothetical protein
MQDNRNSKCGLGCDTQGTVCIDTKRVLDCCRDRDCFEDARVYLTSFGEEVVANATNVRTRCAKLIWAFVGVDEVPFNRGFYQVTVRYYIKVECEACLGIGRSQTFSGIAVLEKDVILYGGEGRVVSYSSSQKNNYCSIGDINTVGTNDPIAVVETVEPIVLSTKVMDCSCGCNSCCNDCCEIPESLCGCIDGELIVNSNGNAPHLYISFGIFSVIRIEREAQILVQATDYSVPDKECAAATNDDNPCSLFNTMPFPANQFRTTMTPCVELQHNGGCGCGGRDRNTQ